ncbi:MAG: ATP-dependent RNA helicase [Thermoanaerobaculia bacterium]|nr:ATP-dependent RNA helicase [Thermoanaerobaculia bacterium]
MNQKSKAIDLAALPVDAHIDAIVATVRERRAAVIVAPPGSGKTTRIPPALTVLGRTIVLQPRRVAARTLARRIAAERGWTVGEEIGWQIRLERRFSSRTQLLVATEGILTARLQSDPLLSDFSVVVLDEFHERSIHADVALALVKQAAASRDDLAIVVMSATIDARPVAEFINAKIIEIPTRVHPIEIEYRETSMAAAVRELMHSARGDILCFLPGVREIERTAAGLADIDADVLPLHGTLDIDAQERALAPSRRRKVILATNVAETSLTVEGVTDVVDSGLQKILRYDSETAVDHLVTEQISRDSADQRAGRAGRTGPGRATRLWDARAILEPQREPEVRRIDLAGPALDIIAWGGEPETFDWFEKPDTRRLGDALRLLERLGAIDGRRITTLGAEMRAMPMHPRLARMVIAAGGSQEALDLATEIAEGGRRRIAGGGPALARAALAGYPDRVAMRRESGSPRLLLATGTGVTLAREIEHTPGDFFVVLEVRGEYAHRVLPIEREWIAADRRVVTHELDGDRVRALERSYYGELPLRQQQVPADPGETRVILARALRSAIDPELLHRVEFAGLDVDWDAVAEQAAMGQSRLSEIRLEPHLPRNLSQLAPASFTLPSGRSTRLDYRENGSVVASAKLQELFGLAETPRIGPRRTPITFELLAPNGRPVQVTQDLRNFWNTTYAEVRKELRGRYPKHPWPDDPWTAQPTHRTKRRT